MSTVFINERGNIYKMIDFIELFTINEMIFIKYWLSLFYGIFDDEFLDI